MLVLSCVRRRGTPNDRAAYEWAVGINGVIIARGHVEAHNRADGWERLVELVAEAARPQRQVRAVTRLATQLERGLAGVPSAGEEIFQTLGAPRSAGRSTPRRKASLRRPRFSRGGRV